MRTPLEWWYHLTAPSEPPPNARLGQREAARRGRLASITLLFMSVVTVLPIPVALIFHNVALLGALIVTLLINGIALVLNRRGKLVAAGVLFVTILDVGFMLSLLTTPGGLDVSNLPTFDLLAEALLVSVAFFPPWSIFIVLLVNSLFILLDLAFQPHAAALGHYLAVNTYDVLIRPIILQIIVAGVTFLWVRSATDAIVRADRAEELATLEQQKLELQERQLEQKRQIDYGIQQILQTHVLVANGNFKARAPLAQDNILWQIAWSLNNLLARLQHYHQLENEQKRTAQALEQFVEAIRVAKAIGQPISIERTGTIIDRLIIELNSTPSRPPSPSARGQVPPVQRGFQQR
jgi:hypothetical protein